MAVNRYVIVWSDPSADDLDRLNFSLNGRDPAYAERWDAGIRQAVLDLTDFPGPLSHARDEEASDQYGREVRRLLYYGPTRRRSGTPVRVLFTIFPPDPDDSPEAAESVILLLRLLRGAQTPNPDGPA